MMPSAAGAPTLQAAAAGSACDLGGAFADISGLDHLFPAARPRALPPLSPQDVAVYGALDTVVDGIRGPTAVVELLPGYASFLIPVETGWGRRLMVVSLEPRRDLDTGAAASAVAQAIATLPDDIRDWVAPVSRHLMVSTENAGSLDSCSSPDMPFCYRIALNPSRSSLQEMVVHESSHQYYNQLVRADAVAEPAAPKVYSALKRTERPLERVVFALHAATNIAAAYRRIVIDHTEPYERAMADLMKLCEVVAGHADHLTPYGRRLCRALFDHVR